MICGTDLIPVTLFNFLTKFQGCLQFTIISSIYSISIPDESLVGGNVPKCITSTTSTTKDTIIIVYFIPIDKNIAEYKVYVNPARWYARLKYILQLLLSVQFR